MITIAHVVVGPGRSGHCLSGQFAWLARDPILYFQSTISPALAHFCIQREITEILENVNGNFCSDTILTRRSQRFIFTMSTPRRGEWIELQQLVSRKDLNEKRAQVVKWHADVGRWELLVQLSQESTQTERVRVYPKNISRDHILMIDADLEVRTEWPAWPSGLSVDEVARKLLVEKCELCGSFNGSFSIHIAGKPTREVTDLGLVVRQPSINTWDESTLSAAILTVLPREVQLVCPHALWSATSARSFQCIITTVLLRAHQNRNVVQLLVRTTANTELFAQMQVLVDAHPSVMGLALGRGTVFCEPTDAVVFHLDNMVKLPVSMTPEQAARKIAEMMEVGCEGTICPICLDDMTTAEEHPVFMPCACKANIHLKCLQKLLAETTCPLCREPLMRI